MVHPAQGTENWLNTRYIVNLLNEKTKLGFLSRFSLWKRGSFISWTSTKYNLSGFTILISLIFVYYVFLVLEDYMSIIIFQIQTMVKFPQIGKNSIKPPAAF